MGPAGMVPCLELSGTAAKCREKSVQKVQTSSDKCVGQEMRWWRLAVARGTVNKGRALGSKAASYIRGLNAKERPIKSIHIDDPKAMFLFRWYQKVDANRRRNRISPS